MDEKLLIGLVERRLTIRQIAAECNSSITNTRYWLRKFGLRTRRGPHGSINGKLRKELDQSNPRKCCGCGTTDITKFYGRRRDYCGKCFNKQKLEAGHKRRDWAIKLLGGKCVICGFDKWRSGFDMHHIDPSKKDIGFSGFRYWSLGRCEKELHKCVLLCRTCHAGVHSGDVRLNGE